MPSIAFDSCRFAGYCSENYDDDRQCFLAAARNNADVIQMSTLPIDAKGPNGQDLAVDVVWLGSQHAKKIVVHISGTHGVEGHVGSAIQRSLLEEPPKLDDEMAILFIHGLNPYGMAHHRRVNENNIDLNRNFSEKRESPSLYEKVDSIMNPKKPVWVDFFHLRMLLLIIWYGFNAVKEAVAGGQYDYPEGLFYGGREIENGPKKVLQLLKDTFDSPLYDETQFTIIDVHTGLGGYAKEMLLVPDEKEGPYDANGVFSMKLKDAIGCAANSRIQVVGQEFGTYSKYRVLMALRNENRAHHYAKRNGKELGVDSPERQKLRHIFYPQDHQWRHLVVQQGRCLVKQALCVQQSGAAATSPSKPDLSTPCEEVPLFL